MENTYTLSYAPSIKELLQLKKALGYSTTKLAKELGMNRSELNQIELGLREVSHKKFVKIFDFLYRQKTKNTKPLYKICSREIVSVNPTDSLKKVKEIMAKMKFDAVPVYDKGRPVGKINSFYVGTMIYPQDAKTKVKDVLEEAPIVVPYDVRTDWVENFLSSIGDLVILTKQGKDYGIVDPWDRINKT